MVLSVIFSVVMIATTMAVLHWYRMPLYRSMAERQKGASQHIAKSTLCSPHELSFEHRIAIVHSALSPSLFSQLCDLITQARGLKRSYVPGHKQGGTICYDRLYVSAPAYIDFYRSAAMCNYLSAIVGESVMPTPDHDQMSCALLVYDKPGDHIGWHYDHNFYVGRHFTVLISLINCSDAEMHSSSILQIKQHGMVRDIPTPENTLVVFEGEHVRHRATPLAQGQKRIILSLTYCTNQSASPLFAISRRIKDIAFIGVRALWT